MEDNKRAMQHLIDNAIYNLNYILEKNDNQKEKNNTSLITTYQENTIVTIIMQLQEL